MDHYREFLKTLTALEPKEFLPKSSSKAHVELLPADTEDQDVSFDGTLKPDDEPVVYPPLELGPELLETSIKEDFLNYESRVTISDGSLSVREDTFPDNEKSEEEMKSPSLELNAKDSEPIDNSENSLVVERNCKSGRNTSWTSSDSALRRPHTISCYSNRSSHNMGEVFFFIDGVTGGWTPSNATTTVLDPNGRPIPVKINLANVIFPRRFICTFLARFPGCYCVSVVIGHHRSHIKGSPFSIPVSRIYQSMPTSRHFAEHSKKCWGIAYSPLSKRVYVADRESHNIIVYYKDGVFDRSFGTVGSKPDQFGRPSGIAVDDRNQRLVISDKDNHRICLYTLDGKFLFTFGCKGYKDGEFAFPWGVSVSPKDSTIAVADSRNRRLQLFNSDGNFLRKYTVFETQPFQYKRQFNYPRGVSFDKNGENIYVTDFKINAVFKLNVELTVKTKMTSGISLFRPQGIAVDAIGNLLICDSRNNCIRVVNSAGNLVTSILGHRFEAFWNPLDVTVMPTGEIIVVDYNSKIRVL